MKKRENGVMTSPIPRLLRAKTHMLRAGAYCMTEQMTMPAQRPKDDCLNLSILIANGWYGNGTTAGTE